MATTTQSVDRYTSNHLSQEEIDFIRESVANETFGDLEQARGIRFHGGTNEKLRTSQEDIDLGLRRAIAGLDFMSMEDRKNFFENMRKQIATTSVQPVSSGAPTPAPALQSNGSQTYSPPANQMIGTSSMEGLANGLLPLFNKVSNKRFPRNDNQNVPTDPTQVLSNPTQVNMGGLLNQAPQQVPAPAPARQSLNDQTPRLVEEFMPEFQNRMVPIVEKRPDPFEVMNPVSTTVTDMPPHLNYREQLKLASDANNGLRDDIFRTLPSDYQDKARLHDTGQQIKAPIFELDTSGIPDSPFRDRGNAQKLKDEVEAREKQEPGFIQKMMADPNFFPQLAISFNTLRLRPDQGLNTAMMKQIENNNATNATNRTANRTANYFTNLGTPAGDRAASWIMSGGDAKEAMALYKSESSENRSADYFSSMGTAAGKEASDWIRAGGDPKEAMKIHREGKSAAQIVSFLENSEDYKDYAAIARENPAMAAKIYEQIIQNKLNPTAKTQISGVQTNAANEMFVVKSQPDGTTTVFPLLDSNGEQIKGRDPAALVEAELALKRYDKDIDQGRSRSQDAMTKVYAIEGNLETYRGALNALADGADSGIIVNNFLPAFSDATARLNQAAISLGIQVINSATFGALSEKELQLALSEGLNLNLEEAELRKHIIGKIDALEKLKIEITRRAAELQDMPYSEYTKRQNAIAQDNMKYLKKPDGVPRETWAMFNAEARKEYYLAGEE